MFTTQLIIKRLTGIETVGKGEKTLTVRWLEADANGHTLAFKVWNDLTRHPRLTEKAEIEVDFKITSRESGDRFFTELTILKIH